jgi:hypothetical protein
VLHRGCIRWDVATDLDQVSSQDREYWRLTRSFRMALLDGMGMQTTQERLKDVHDKDHLLLELSLLIVFWAYFPVEVQQFLESLAL